MPKNNLSKNQVYKIASLSINLINSFLYIQTYFKGSNIRFY